MSQTSPAASGGAGPNFEQRVGAFLLALLLTRSGPPFAPRARIRRIRQQAEEMNWATDDYFVEAQRPDGALLRILVQVKRSFAIVANDPICAKLFGDAWRDFSGGEFKPATDCMLVLTGALGKAPKEALRMLLDCATASSDGADFVRRVALPGYLNEAARRYAAIIRAALDGAKQSPVSDEEFRGFLRVFQFAELDLETPGGAIETVTKGLLAAHDGNLDEAENDWNELVVLAGSGGPRAFAHAADTFSPRLLQRHTAPSSVWCGGGKLHDYSAMVARRARRQVGAARPLPRAELQSEVLRKLESCRIVLVIGDAGSGKSGVGAAAFETLAAREPTVAFPAEAFAQPHLANVLEAIGLPLTEFTAGPAGSGRVVVWIESLERMLEKDDRTAFDDLINLVAREERLRVLITCREYSFQLAHAAFFARLAIPCEVVRVPPLTDAELVQIAAELPTLAVPLGNPRLKELLRNPFLLDMAARLNWAGSAPATEREFRQRVWSEVIRREDRPAGDAPARREEVFIAVAVRRAQHMRPWVDVSDLSGDMLRRLADDGLINVHPENSALAAPAHDVLEDWSLLNWMQREFQRVGTSPSAFVAAVGVSPSVRRIYRRWLLEFIDRDPGANGAFAFQIIGDQAVPRHWRDDTLTAILLSSEAVAMLEANRATLRANGHTLLRRAVHLLRVAGKKNIPLVRETALVPGVFLLPHGPAWSALMVMIEAEFQHFGGTDREFLTGFLEDFVRLCSAAEPYPRGADSAARVAWRLLAPALPHLARNSVHERLANVVLTVPKPVEAELAAHFKATLPTERFESWRPSLASFAIRFLGGQSLARDLPELVVACADRWLDLDDREPKDRDRHDRRREDIESVYGLPQRLHHDTFPPSAWRGPFLALLVYHPRIGVDFIVGFLNRAMAHYADPKNRFRRGGPPPQLTLDLGAKGVVQQFAAAEFWVMYRALGRAPHVMESALMALEAWLLRKVDEGAGDVPVWLEELLVRSNNVAITAVVASVACAAPAAAGAVAMPLFAVQIFFDWDHQRLVGDQMPLDRIAGLIPTGDPEHAVFDQERKMSGERSHRRASLEWLMMSLQETALKPQIEAILDRARAALPALEAQTDLHRIIRIRLDRIDRRGWQITPDEKGRPQVTGPKPAPDVQRLIDRVQPGLNQNFAIQSALGWGRGRFQKGRGDDSQSTDWHERLIEGQRLLLQAETAEEEIDRVNLRAAATYIGAVVVRDRWAELTPAEQQWCVRTAVTAVARPPSKEVLNFDDGPFNGAQPAAWTLGLLLGYELSPEMKSRVLAGFAIAFTHFNQRIRILAVGGLCWEPARTQSYFAPCLQALITEAAELVAINTAEETKEWDQRRRHEDIGAEARTKARERFLTLPTSDVSDLGLIGLAERDVRNVLGLALIMVDSRTECSLARTFYSTLVSQLRAIWQEDRRGNSSRDTELENIAGRNLVEFSLIGTPEQALALLRPLVEEMKTSPREVADLLQDLIGAEDRQHSGAAFWAVWQLIADQFVTAVGSDQINDRSRDTSVLVRLFLGVDWKEGVEDWKPLHGQHHRVDALFRALPPSVWVFAAYTRYLRGPGGGSLPGAFAPLSEGFAALPANEGLIGDTQLHLEVMLANYVHGAPGALKADARVNAAVVSLLDQIVERGSAAAFRMRDDFVTHTT